MAGKSYASTFTAAVHMYKWCRTSRRSTHPRSLSASNARHSSTRPIKSECASPCPACCRCRTWNACMRRAHSHACMPVPLATTFKSPLYTPCSSPAVFCSPSADTPEFWGKSSQPSPDMFGLKAALARDPSTTLASVCTYRARPWALNSTCLHHMHVSNGSCQSSTCRCEMCGRAVPHPQETSASHNVTDEHNTSMRGCTAGSPTSSVPSHYYAHRGDKLAGTCTPRVFTP